MKLFAFVLFSWCWFNGHSQQLKLNEIKELGFLPPNSMDSFLTVNAYSIDKTNTSSPGDGGNYTFYKKKGSPDKAEGIFIESRGYDPSVLIFVSGSNVFYNNIKQECVKDKSCKSIKIDGQKSEAMYCKDDCGITFSKTSGPTGQLFMIRAEPMCQRCLEAMIDSNK